jgi:hypothetical protein
MMELAQYAGHKVKLYIRIRICFGKFRLPAKETEYDLIRIRNFVCTVYALKKIEKLHATPLFVDIFFGICKCVFPERIQNQQKIVGYSKPYAIFQLKYLRLPF